MKNVSEIEKMFRVIANINDGFKQIDEVYTKDSSCDKKGWNFNLDSRFAASKGVTIYVSSWKGWYGDSGCSTIFGFDADIFNAHLLKVLQSKFRPIMTEVAESIRKEAAKQKEEAIKELKEKLKSIESI